MILTFAFGLCCHLQASAQGHLAIQGRLCLCQRGVLARDAVGYRV